MTDVSTAGREREPTPRELLAFYLECGVDCALTDDPVNRLSDEVVAEVDARPPAQPAAAAPPGKSRLSAGVPSPPVMSRANIGLSAEIAIAEAREAARTAPSLDALRAIIEAFEGCALKSTATRLVFADGNPEAKVMFVGEAPGREEDLAGLPFVGRSGKLLDLMLAAIGLDRGKAYIANVIPWRPPGNRDPSPQETQMCLPFIKRQIELVDPDVLVCLGKPSSQTLLDLKDGIMKTRGRWRDYPCGTRSIQAMATFHPAYLLRQPSYKRLAWQDLRAIAKMLAESPR